MEHNKYTMEYHDQVARELLLREGFVLIEEAVNKKGQVYSVFYSKNFFKIEHLLLKNRFHLREFASSRRMKGKTSAYNNVNSLIEAVKAIEQHSKIIKRNKTKEKRWNKETKLRLQTKAKKLKELLDAGFSLSKACKEVDLEYKMGKLLVEEKFILDT